MSPVSFYFFNVTAGNIKITYVASQEEGYHSWLHPG